MLFLLLALASAQAGDVPDFVWSIIHQMEAAEKQLRDSTYVLVMEEYVDGALTPSQQLSVKYRRPHEVYMTWVGDVHQGREVLYRQGWNDNRIRVNAGSLVPTLNLDPHGRMALRDTRHAITDAGLPFAVGVTSADTHRVANNSALHAEFRDLGTLTVNKSPALCYEADLPKAQDPGFYATKARVCMDLRTHLPASFEVWDMADGAVRLVERFNFTDVHVNVGLTDEDFDPDNPAYGF